MLFASRGRKVGPAIFDRRHRRLVQGMVSYLSPALTGPTGLQLLDLSGENRNATMTGINTANDWIRDQIGYAVNFTGSNSFATSSNLPVRASTDPISIGGWFFGTAASYTTSNYFMAIPSVSSGSNGMDLSNPQAVQFNLFGTGNNRSIVSTVDIRNRWVHIVAVYDGLTGFLYANGSLVGQVSQTAGTSTLSRELNVARFGSFGGFAAVRCAQAFVHYRAITAAESLELFRLGPSGLGHPERISLGIFEATIGFSILADTGAYTLSGLPIPLLYGRSIAADAASILLQGQTTPLRLSRLLGADPRSYQFSGVDAGILLGRLLDAGAAAYTVDGTSAGFLASRRISAESVAYLASGQDAAFLRSRVIQAGTGQYILVASPIDIQTGTGGAAPYYYLFLLGGSR